ncbi:hypothetical protein A3K79_03455 [Candidatus Bathyarchaeota archaeon RBG_13_46_16b]|nr:MAG: hypothetical protein A3K79_03455 [Candidatus Bathyarchaeota archaeon RBG_13_46_16b]
MEPYFTKAEYEIRYKRAYELMAARDLDALFATNVINYTYFGGHVVPGLAPWTTRPFLLVLPMNEKPVVIAQLGAKEGIVKTSNIRRTKFWTKLPFDVSIVEETLKELNLSKGKVGCEFGLEEHLGISQNDFVKLQRGLPKAKFVDASDIFCGLRMVKTQAEIECIRKTCQVTSDAYEKTFSNLRVGMSPDDVQALFFGNIARQNLTPHFILCRFWSKNGRSMHIKREGVVWLDGGSVYKGYRCDFSRMVAVGSIAENARAMYTKMRGITWKLVEMVKPGLKVSDIARAAIRLQKEAGVGNAKLESIGRIGHGLGLGFGDPYSFSTELPSVSLEDETVLQPGMVITIEPGETTNYGYFTLEEDLVVTEDGYELLSEEVSDPELPLVCKA